jgi:hypothetical protein
LLTVVLACTFSMQALALDYVITDHGAVADGITVNSKAIQALIEKVSSGGGGRIIVPAGTFVTGTINLKSGVELHLDRDAVLLGSLEKDDYYGNGRWVGLVIASGQDNIAVTGEGTMDGRGGEVALGLLELYLDGKMPGARFDHTNKRLSEVHRPQLIEFIHCTNVKVADVTLKNAACWVQTYEQCDGLVIDNVTVDSNAYWNNDGMDIGDCKNVRITNCYVNSADDGICLKSHNADSFCENVYIGNCTVRSSASAIKFGTASRGGFRNVTIENITVFDTYRSALALEAVDGGTIDGVTATNITAKNTGNALFIRLGHRNVDGEPGAVRNITIKNLKAEIPFGQPDLDYPLRGPVIPYFHNPFPASITGFSGHTVENITLEDIEITYPGRANKAYSWQPLNRLDEIEEHPSRYYGNGLPPNPGFMFRYPEFSIWKELPSWALYVRFVDGLTMKNVRMRVLEDDFRPAYVFQDVRNLTIEGASIYPKTDAPQLIVHNVQGADIRGVSVRGNELGEVQASGVNSGIKGVEKIE